MFIGSANGKEGKSRKILQRNIFRLRPVIGGAGIYMRFLNMFSKRSRLKMGLSYEIKERKGIGEKERLRKKGGKFINDKIL